MRCNFLINLLLNARILLFFFVRDPALKATRCRRLCQSSTSVGLALLEKRRVFKTRVKTSYRSWLCSSKRSLAFYNHSFLSRHTWYGRDTMFTVYFFILYVRLRISQPGLYRSAWNFAQRFGLISDRFSPIFLGGSPRDGRIFDINTTP